jgi:malate dehydrogenase (oxaloacetate-decarboxylating)
VITVRAREVTVGMFLAAARALADETGAELVAKGQLYPDIVDVRDVSRAVAIAVARKAIEEGVADHVENLEEMIDAEMWTAEYLPYRQVGMGPNT